MSDTSCKLGVSEGIPCPSPPFLREQKRSVVNHKHAFIHSEFHGELRSPDNRATCSGEWLVFWGVSIVSAGLVEKESELHRRVICRQRIQRGNIWVRWIWNSRRSRSMVQIHGPDPGPGPRRNRELKRQIYQNSTNHVESLKLNYTCSVWIWIQQQQQKYIYILYIYFTLTFGSSIALYVSTVSTVVQYTVWQWKYKRQ